MSKISSVFGMYALAAMAMSASSPSNSERRSSTESENERNQRLSDAEIQRNLRNGLKEFHYAENSLWARDQKNADRKATKKGWL